ncbi:nodulation protein NodH [Rhodobacteraceae bacterium CCMM004]|nr:nodulation protein NodH [Rhodobacteraceae bacterium CCMM004]
MAQRFSSFMVLAAMRTGSNFLEENLNAIPGLRCWGEAFNPHFVGHARQERMAGMDLAARTVDPFALLDAMQERTEGLAGFRFFQDHDRRILDRCLPDPACAKVVLSRNPLESFVSLQIARQTGQWRLGDMKHARRARIRFDPAEFALHLGEAQAFRMHILRTLQTTGQTAFYLDYQDVGDLDVLNGLAAFLGTEGRLAKVEQKTKVQNPAGLRDKVENYDEMVAALGDIDHFDMGRTPNFEPRRGPNVPGFYTAAAAPVLFMPLRGGPTDRVTAWLAGLDGVPVQRLGHGLSQKDLRRWKRQAGRHLSFSVLRHPLARAHAAFCRRILVPGPDCYADLRETLRTHYAIPLPEGAPGADYGPADHGRAFRAFLTFLRGNLGGQTGVRVDASWASQSALLQGMGQFLLPDRLLREENLARDLDRISADLGLAAVPLPDAAPDPGPVALTDIHDGEVEAMARDVYKRDYMMFGFEDWRRG